MHGDKNFNSNTRPNLGGGGGIRPHPQPNNRGHFPRVVGDLHGPVGLPWNPSVVRYETQTTKPSHRRLQWGIIAISFVGVLAVGITAIIQSLGG